MKWSRKILAIQKIFSKATNQKMRSNEEKGCKFVGIEKLKIPTFKSTRQLSPSFYSKLPKAYFAG